MALAVRPILYLVVDALGNGRLCLPLRPACASALVFAQYQKAAPRRRDYDALARQIMRKRLAARLRSNDLTVCVLAAAFAAANSSSLADASRSSSCARLRADVDRYSVIVSDLHRLLVASLPAHYEGICTLSAHPVLRDRATGSMAPGPLGVRCHFSDSRTEYAPQEYAPQYAAPP